MKLLAVAMLALVSPIAFSQTSSTSAVRYGTSEALSVQDARVGQVLMVRFLVGSGRKTRVVPLEMQ